MSPDAQEVAIAKACGWHEPHSTERDLPYWTDHNHTAYGSTLPPKYTSDLNAMRNATVTVIHRNMHTRRKYYQELDKITGDQWNTIDATAAQRAEAFLRVLNLWTD